MRGVGCAAWPRHDSHRRPIPLKGTVVQKFGGTSVSGPGRLKAVARRVASAAADGHPVCVVVSAMGDTTDELIKLAREVNPDPPEREMDMLLTAGERISGALLCMALEAEGIPAVSFTGSQAGVITDPRHGRAMIVDVRPVRVREALEHGRVAVVAGFQGMSHETRDITTLGRGGSDTSAVAMAAALDADVCEVYTDVEGVYTADPRIVPGARKLHVVSYDEMLEMSSSGAKVLMLRSVEYARNNGVALHVRSSFSDEPGTWVREEDERMEKAIISGITHDESEAKLTLHGVPDRPGIAGRLFRALASAEVNVDLIVQNVSADGETDVSFTVGRDDSARAAGVLERVAAEIDASGFDVDDAIAKVSLVGAGMRSHPGIAATMFEVLGNAGVNIEMISTSPIRISCVVREDQVADAVRLLHDTFELETEVAERESHDGVERIDTGPSGAGGGEEERGEG